MAMDGMLEFQRDWVADPYWDGNNVWKTFLNNDVFDHAYFIDVFKTICGDCELRNKILRYFINDNKTMIFNPYEPDDSIDMRLTSIAATIKKANWKQRKAYITWEFPNITDERSDQESHCVVFIYDPTQDEVTYIDSRGIVFARSYCTLWTKAFQKLKQMFSHCTWIDVVTEDMQAKNSYDNFCQTWSLILTIEHEQLEQQAESNDTETETGTETESVCSHPSRQSYTETTHATTSTSLTAHSVHRPTHTPTLNVTTLMTGYKSILSFWKKLVSVDTFREAIYYEIYRSTHLADGAHRYNRYFTTLESLVNRSNTAHYPFGVSYKHTGYTFIEDFLDSLDEETLRRILA